MDLFVHSVSLGLKVIDQYFLFKDEAFNYIDLAEWLISMCMIGAMKHQAVLKHECRGKDWSGKPGPCALAWEDL